MCTRCGQFWLLCSAPVPQQSLSHRDCHFSAMVCYSTDLAHDTCFAPVAARTVLQKPPATRSTVEVNWLTSFLKGMRFFAQFGVTTLRRLCSKLRYSRVLAGTVVVTQGEAPNPREGFFVVLSGCMNVHRKSTSRKTGLDRKSMRECEQCHSFFLPPHTFALLDHSVQRRWRRQHRLTTRPLVSMWCHCMPQTHSGRLRWWLCHPGNAVKQSC